MNGYLRQYQRAKRASQRRGPRPRERHTRRAATTSELERVGVVRHVEWRQKEERHREPILP